MAKLNEDGNLFGRITAFAAIVATALYVGKLACGGGQCPFMPGKAGQSCHMVAPQAAAPAEKAPAAAEKAPADKAVHADKTAPRVEKPAETK
jgi:hypothetical protein